MFTVECLVHAAYSTEFAASSNSCRHARENGRRGWLLLSVGQVHSPTVPPSRAHGGHRHFVVDFPRAAYALGNIRGMGSNAAGDDTLFDIIEGWAEQDARQE